MNLIAEILNSWGWVGIVPEEVVKENDFGNLIIRDREGRYWRLSPEDIYCEVVAKNREEFDKLSMDHEFRADWYMEPLVTQARETLGPLSEGRKYHLVIPGALGGEYAISNIKTAPLVELIRFSGNLGSQLKDLPEGAQIELKVVD